MAVIHGSSLRTPMALEEIERLGETHHHEWYDITGQPAVAVGPVAVSIDPETLAAP